MAGWVAGNFNPSGNGYDPPPPPDFSPAVIPKPTGTRPYRLHGWPNHLFPSPPETVFLGLGVLASFRKPRSTAICFSDSVASHAAAALHDPPFPPDPCPPYKCRGGAARVADWIQARYRPESAESTAREEGRRYCSAGGSGLHLLAVSLAVPRRPFAVSLRFAAAAFSLADRRGTYALQRRRLCGTPPALRVSC